MGRKSNKFPAFLKNKSPPPALNQKQHTQPPGSGIGSSITSGFGLGLGLEGARAAVSGISSVISGGDENSNQREIEAPNSGEKCNFEKDLLNKCLKKNNGDNFHCKEWFELLNNCYKSQKQ